MLQIKFAIYAQRQTTIRTTTCSRSLTVHGSWIQSIMKRNPGHGSRQRRRRPFSWLLSMVITTALFIRGSDQWLLDSSLCALDDPCIQPSSYRQRRTVVTGLCTSGVFIVKRPRESTFCWEFLRRETGEVGTVSSLPEISVLKLLPRKSIGS